MVGGSGSNVLWGWLECVVMVVGRGEVIRGGRGGLDLVKGLGG